MCVCAGACIEPAYNQFTHHQPPETVPPPLYSVSSHPDHQRQNLHYPHESQRQEHPGYLRKIDSRRWIVVGVEVVQSVESSDVVDK